MRCHVKECEKPVTYLSLPPKRFTYYFCAMHASQWRNQELEPQSYIDRLIQDHPIVKLQQAYRKA